MPMLVTIIAIITQTAATIITRCTHM